jgi:hypothetical protein
MMKIRLHVAASLILLAAVGAMAHHSFDAEYDSSKVTTITGYVTKLDWVNPHAFVYLDSRDDKGQVRHFKIEMGPPYALSRNGWTKDILKIGDKITIENAALAKDGSNSAGSMQNTSMTLASGQKMVMR